MKNYKSTRLERGDRTFLLEFWHSASLGMDLPYARVSEVVTKDRWPRWLFRNSKPKEEIIKIDDGWMRHNRVDWCIGRIYQYLNQEEEAQKDLEDIEALCEQGEECKCQDLT